jgi:hypothetical protein
MKTFELTFSFPPIHKAPHETQEILRKYYNYSIVTGILKRHNLNGTIIESDKKGPLFLVSDVLEHEVDGIERNMRGSLRQLIGDSNALKVFIKADDLQIDKKSNYDELIKKLPELEGIF